MRRGLLSLLIVLVPTIARAGTPIDESSPHGVMMMQALHTLGAQTVVCPAAAGSLATAASRVTCAQVPGSMYGFFREAVHGRLYEYISRKTLTLASDWSTHGDILSVRYNVDGGTLTVARLRADGVLYAVFVFVPPAQTAAPPVGQGEASIPTGSGSSTTSASATDGNGAPASGGQP